MKHKMKVMFMIGSILCVVILMLSLIQKKRVEKETSDLCDINAMTQENQENGNASVLYDKEKQELSFTDNVAVDDTCLSFDVITYLAVANEEMYLLNKSSLARETSPSDNVSLLKIYWGEFFITEQSMQSQLIDSSLVLDGMATIETQSGKIRETYQLNIHYVYDIRENLICERTVYIGK